MIRGCDLTKLFYVMRHNMLVIIFGTAFGVHCFFKIWDGKTCKIRRDFGLFQTLTANIARTNRDIDKQKTALIVTIFHELGQTMVSFGPSATKITMLMFIHSKSTLRELSTLVQLRSCHMTLLPRELRPPIFWFSNRTYGAGRPCFGHCLKFLVKICIASNCWETDRRLCWGLGLLFHGLCGSNKLLYKRCAKSMGSCLLYTSPSPRDRTRSRMPSSA